MLRIPLWTLCALLPALLPVAARAQSAGPVDPYARPEVTLTVGDGGAAFRYGQRLPVCAVTPNAARVRIVHILASGRTRALLDEDRAAGQVCVEAIAGYFAYRACLTEGWVKLCMGGPGRECVRLVVYTLVDDAHIIEQVESCYEVEAASAPDR